MFMDRRLSVKMSFFPNWSVDSYAIPIKIPESYFMNIDKLILKFIWRGKRPRIANTILMNKVEGLMLSDFKTYYKDTAIKTGWYWWKEADTSMEQNREPETGPHKYSQLIFWSLKKE